MSAVAAAAVLAGLLATVAGCESSDNELQRLVCEVQTINAGEPLVSGYWDAGQDKIFPSDDDFLPIDVLPVTFHARPYNSAITLPDEAPFSYFHITSYDLVWHPVSPGSEALVPYGYVGAGLDILVPAGGEATVGVLVVDRYVKEQAFFRDLANNWPASIPLTARGELIFHGHETGSDGEVTLRGSFMGNFVGVVIQQN